MIFYFGSTDDEKTIFFFRCIVGEVVLNVCYSGTPEYSSEDIGYNTAIALLMSGSTIGSVKAWDGLYIYHCNLLGFKEYGESDSDVNRENPYIYYISISGSIESIGGEPEVSGVLTDD